MNKKDLKNIWMILLLFIIILVVLLNSKYSFGNTINYYKELKMLNILKNNYLETKRIIPTFINDNGVYYSSFNYIKYGLFNPIVILSYFINISLDDYYSVLSVLSLGLAMILLYKFLFKEGFNRYSVLITSAFLIISKSLYLIMFNSILDMLVFPLIILAFMGAKKRLELNKGTLLSISIFLISIVNYKYLFPVIIGLLVYCLYNYYVNNQRILFKKIFWYSLYYIVPILIGILMASFALIPVVDELHVNSIIINYNINVIVVLSILYGLWGNKNKRFLSVSVFIYVVLFSTYYLVYLLLLGILISNFIDGIIKRKNNYKVLFGGIIFSLIYLLIDNSNLITIIVLLLSIFLYQDTKRKSSLMILIIFVFINSLYSLASIDLYNRNLLSKDFYTNNEYNTMYQMLIGNNKINNNLIGYRKVMNEKGEIYYKNDDVLFKGFATNNIISYEDYEKLNGIAKQEVILTNIVADKNSKNEYVSYVNDIKLSKDKYDIKIVDSKKYVFKLDELYKNKILYIEFDAKSNDCNNSRIKINNIVNEISCKREKYSYTISDKDLKELVVYIDRGVYKINNIKVYSLDYGRIINSKMELDEFIFKKSNDKIVGNIRVSGDGYFVINIPYDRGYELKIDGKSIRYEKVNNNYLGVPITKGEHVISIDYDIRYRLMTWFFSYLGLTFLIFVNYLEKKRRFT